MIWMGGEWEKRRNEGEMKSRKQGGEGKKIKKGSFKKVLTLWKEFHGNLKGGGNHTSRPLWLVKGGKRICL